jgi:hypothetical protein
MLEQLLKLHQNKLSADIFALVSKISLFTLYCAAVLALFQYIWTGLAVIAISSGALYWYVKFKWKNESSNYQKTIIFLDKKYKCNDLLPTLLEFDSEETVISELLEQQGNKTLKSITTKEPEFSVKKSLKKLIKKLLPPLIILLCALLFATCSNFAGSTAQNDSGSHGNQPQNNTGGPGQSDGTSGKGKQGQDNQETSKDGQPKQGKNSKSNKSGDKKGKGSMKRAQAGQQKGKPQQKDKKGNLPKSNKSKNQKAGSEQSKKNQTPPVSNNQNQSSAQKQKTKPLKSNKPKSHPTRKQKEEQKKNDKYDPKANGNVGGKDADEILKFTDKRDIQNTIYKQNREKLEAILMSPNIPKSYKSKLQSIFKNKGKNN